MNNRAKLLKAISDLNKIIYAEDTTNKWANQIKVSRDLIDEVAESLETLEILEELTVEDSHE